VLEQTALAGGDTRPALVKYIGLPLKAVIALVVAYGMIMALMPNWTYRFVGFGILVVAAVSLWAIMRRDHNALRIFRLWCQGKGKSLDSHHWNGASVDPFPLRRSRTPRGIA
jgi:type IV secretory pathway VirB3-like protein